MRFIKEKHPGCKKITFSAPIIRTDNYSANKENESFISKNQTCHISPTIILLKTFI